MILLTNDDGITAKGILVLRQALSRIDTCYVVAPDGQQSASAHAISISRAVAVADYYEGAVRIGYQVQGTPADCVKLALCELLTEQPVLVVSGINRGPNTGVSVYYSGTVSAAREATIAGIPAIAVSMCSNTYDDFTYTCELITNIARRVISGGLPAGITLNVNVPPLDAADIRGIKITKQAQSRFIERYVKKGTQDGAVLYALTGELELVDTDSSNDEQAVKDGYVSVTPLQLDLTAFRYQGVIEKLVVDTAPGFIPAE